MDLLRRSGAALRLVALLSVVAVLAACARSPGAGPSAPSVSVAALHDKPVRGDSRPHSGVDGARRLPIQGIDIARYQGVVDFEAARRDGIHFVWMKGTEGKDYVDPAYYLNWDSARRAGVARGVYHFMTWCSLASEQARWFVEMMPNDPDMLPPVLDVEWNNHSSCKNKHNRADVLEKIRVMLAAMEKHTGKLPIIYTDINFHRDILAGEHFDNPFWLRSTAAEPHEKYSSRRWTFWQWTQTGVVDGIKVSVDRNAFYGDQNAWTTFLLTGCDPRDVKRLGPKGRCRSHK